MVAVPAEVQAIADDLCSSTVQPDDAHARMNNGGHGSDASSVRMTDMNNMRSSMY